MTVVVKDQQQLRSNKVVKSEGKRGFLWMGKIMKGYRSTTRARVSSESRRGDGFSVFRVSDNDMVVSSKPFFNKFSDDHTRNKEKTFGPSKNLNRRILHEIENYCEKTTLHGLRYVGDTSLTLCERIFWLLSFVIAIGFATYYISNVYARWNSSPVIISFSPFDADLSSIPFPAVTICNMNQVKKTEALKIKAEGNPMELKLLNDLCNGNEADQLTTPYNWTTLRNFLIRSADLKLYMSDVVTADMKAKSLADIGKKRNLYEVGTSCSEMMKVCEWSSESQDCEELFNNDLTDEGLCCSFNRLPPNYIFRNPNSISLLNQTYPSNAYDWNPEKGFLHRDDGDGNNVPKRPLGSGAHLGLTVVLDAQIDEYYCSSTSSVGFKIILSNPIETPKMADFGSLLSPGVEVRYAITPSVREASENLRGISVEKRQCYFANERILQYYRTYTKSNCDLECLSLLLHDECKCVPYYLPKNWSMRFCEQTDQHCVDRMRYNIRLNENDKFLCSCYSECTSIKYSAKTYIAKIGSGFSVGQFNNTKHDRRNVTIIHWFFEFDQYTKIMHKSLFESTDLVASTGSILSVFMGSSILSPIEVLYYLAWKSLWRLKSSPKTYPFIN